MAWKDIEAAAKRGDALTVRNNLLDQSVWNDKGNECGLIVSIVTDHTDIARILIENGAPLTGKDGAGGNPLVAAALRGKMDLVQLLLEKGVDPGEKNDYGNNALHAAACNNHCAVAKVFLDRGMNINEKNNLNMTPLLFAVQNRHPDMARFLLEAGASADERDPDTDGYITVSLSKEKGHPEIMQILKDGIVQKKQRAIEIEAASSAALKKDTPTRQPLKFNR